MWQVRFIEINFFAIETGSSFPIEHCISDAAQWPMMYADTFTDQRTKIVSVVEGKALLKKKTFWSNKPFVADIFIGFFHLPKRTFHEQKNLPKSQLGFLVAKIFSLQRMATSRGVGVRVG